MSRILNGIQTNKLSDGVDFAVNTHETLLKGTVDRQRWEDTWNFFLQNRNKDFHI